MSIFDLGQQNVSDLRGGCGVIYARVASVEQDDPLEKLNQQIAECERFARSQKLRLGGIYVDPGSSGRDANRAGLRKMLDDAVKHPKPFDFILLYSYNRLSRDEGLYVTFCRYLSKCGIEVVSISEPRQSTVKSPGRMRMIRIKKAGSKL